MKATITIIVICFVGALTVFPQKFTIMSYNCENAFDTIHDEGKNDMEYLPGSPRRWTRWRMFQKLEKIGKVIAAASATVPVDIVCLEEVENDTVLSYLTRRTPLASVGYEYVMTHSADVRGIDVALLYSPFTFHPFSHHAIRANTTSATRDVLYVGGTAGKGDTLDIYVVHLPSKLNGRKSMKNREVVISAVVQSLDSLRGVRNDPHVVILGDFNDGPKSKLCRTYFASFVNLSEQYGLIDGSKEARVKGTYKYNGFWDCIDQIIVSKNLAGGKSYILNFPFLLEDDTKFGGIKPFRTYIGYKYNKGFSDHLPVMLKLIL